MIIKSIVLENFRQFYNTIPLAFNHSQDKNVVVILGNNGSGKTTLNQAFIFCLFGLKEVNFNDLEGNAIKDVNDPKEIRKICNNKAFNEKKGQFNISVQVVFEHNNIQYDVTRKYLCYVPLGQNEYTFSAEVFEGKKMYISTADKDKSPKPLYEHELRNIMPKALSPIFFFDGERMEELVTEKQKSILSTAVINILDLLPFRKTLRYLKVNNHAATLSNSTRTVENLISKEGAKINNTEDFSTEKEKVEEESTSLEIEKQKLLSEITQLKIDKDDLFNKIKQLSSNKKDQEIREGLIRENERIEAQIITNEKDVLTLFSEKFLGVLSLDYAEVVKNTIENGVHKDKGIKGIHSVAIDCLLEKGVCLCGNCVPEGSTERKKLIEWKDSLPPNDLSTLFTSLKDDMLERKLESEKFITGFEEHRKRINKLQNDFDENSNRIQDIILNNRLIEELDVLEKQYEITDKAITSKIRRNDEITGKLLELDKKQKELTKKIEEQLANVEELSKIKDKMDLLNSIHALIEKSSEVKEKKAKELLEQYAGENYQYIEQKKYALELNQDYSFDIYDSSYTKITESLSEGEKVVASFAFIGALIKVAKKQNKVLIADGNQDYPIVMDAPFAKLDIEHRQKVADKLPTFSSQVIIFSADSQYEGIIKETIAPKVSRVFKLNFDKDEEISSIE